MIELRNREIRRTISIPRPRRHYSNQERQRTQVFRQNMADPQPQTAMRANVHMPAFKPTDILGWFRRLEHWFTLQNITSELNRFSLIASQLNDPALAHLAEWSPTPAENPYTTVKAKIIAIYEESTQTKIQKLMEQKPLGDLKPSLLLAEMKNIDVGLTDDVLRNLWIKRLPEAAQSVLALTTDMTLDKAAKAADAIVESINSAKAVNQISSESMQISELNAKIDALTKAFGSFKQRDRSKSKNRSESEDKENEICRFHRKYGDDVRRCLLPCAHPTKPNN